METDTFRVASKLTTEERKEKIHKYMKKRNERNFSKKIKVCLERFSCCLIIITDDVRNLLLQYACRKTLADSRPRVRGRFAKNDEYGENNRTTCNNHEEDTDEDIKSFRVMQALSR